MHRFLFVVAAIGPLWGQPAREFDAVYLAYHRKPYQMSPKGLLQPILTERFHLTLGWADEHAPAYLLEVLEFNLGDDPAAGPSIFDAGPDQLGLTLKTGKAPVHMLFIDRATRLEAN
jgi:hypothetical protein